MGQNASSTAGSDLWSAAPDEQVVVRATERALAPRQALYASEVRRLLDAGLIVMRRFGTTRSPRVSDILEEAGLSRDTFYRHFSSKEELVAAIVEAGAARLVGYLRHQMAKEADPAGRLAAWVEGILSQAANPELAEATRAVLWNGGQVGDRARPEAAMSVGRFAELVVGPLGDLGSSDPARDASLVAHATMGFMRERLWHATAPDATDVAHLVAFCSAAVSRCTEPVA